MIFILSIPTASFAWGLEFAGGAWYQKPSGNMSFDKSTHEDDLDLEDDLSYGDKWKAFGWHVIDVDGHNMAQIVGALDEAGGIKGKPSVIIANTTKGKGVSFFENKVEYHGVAPSREELDKAVKEISNE